MFAFFKNKLTRKIFKLTLTIFNVCRKHVVGQYERLADNLYGQLLLFLYMLTLKSKDSTFLQYIVDQNIINNFEIITIIFRIIIILLNVRKTVRKQKKEHTK